MRGHRIFFWLQLLALSDCLRGRAASAQPLCDFEQPVFIERGHRVKDHSLIHAEGRFHLFYTRGALGGGSDPSLGHASSEDLRRWVQHAAPLAVDPGERSLWAPQVLPAAMLPAAWRPAGARWAILFTAVNGAGSQSIALAWSADLEQWSREPAPIYRPGAWASWSETDWADCRDPFLFAAGDSLFLLTCARTASGLGALALAAAPAAAIGPPAFADRGPLIVAPDAGALESPQLCFPEAAGSGACRLLFTRAGVFGTSALAAPDWRGPWDLAAAIKIDEGAAPELTPLPAALAVDPAWAPPSATRCLFSRHENYLEWGVHNFAIQFDLLDLAPALWPPALHDRQGLIGWTLTDLPGGPNPFALAPTFEDNPMARGAALPSGYVGHSWLSSFEAYRSVTGGVASQVGDSLGTAAVGRARSPQFLVTGARLDFLIGGAGHADSCALSLRRASDGALLFRATPPGGTGTGVPGGEGLPLVPRAWDTRSLRGLAANLEIEDRAQGPGGFIALDELVWSDADPAAAEPPLLTPPALGFALSEAPANPWLPAAGPLRLALRIDRPGPYGAALYDLRGRCLARFGAADYPAGTAALALAAVDLPAGVYLLRIFGPHGALSRKLVLLR
ncbi:hypothetical protein FJ251_12250 [bacterium]|nr:hypothetical protein [bacterium]